MSGITAADVGPQTVTSPVLAEWFLGWDGSFGQRDPGEVRRYARRLAASGGTAGQEIRRQWLVLDWVMRVGAPIWLDAAGLGDEAEQLRGCRPVVDGPAIRDAGEAAVAVAQAATGAHERAWSYVAGLAQPDVDRGDGRPPWRPAPGDTDPGRVRAWGGLAEGTRSVIPPVGWLVAPACRALGYDPRRLGEAPAVVRAAAVAAGEAAGVVAWAATRRLVAAPTWSWHASPSDAWQRAHALAGVALRRAEQPFADSARELVEEMFRITEEDRCTC